ncbi:14587_t:CDS:2, partial [Gigaspora rosea]
PDPHVYQFSPNNPYIVTNPKMDIQMDVQMNINQEDSNARQATQVDNNISQEKVQENKDRPKLDENCFIDVESDYGGDSNDNQIATQHDSNMEIESIEQEATIKKIVTQQSYRDIIVNPRRQTNTVDENTGDANWKEIVKQKYMDKLSAQREREFDSEEWHNDKILEAFNDETELLPIENRRHTRNIVIALRQAFSFSQLSDSYFTNQRQQLPEDPTKIQGALSN